jgi:FAD/FMN-containing dehydrogenase
MTTEHSEYASFARDIYGKVTFLAIAGMAIGPPWLQVIEQHPAFIVEAASVDDVVACVNLARESKLVLGVMSTGHGIAAPCDSGLILRLSNLTHIEIDAARRTARIEPGVVSRELLEAAHKHHLAYPARQVSNVGVVGYMVGGGKGGSYAKLGSGRYRY